MLKLEYCGTDDGHAKGPRSYYACCSLCTQHLHSLVYMACVFFAPVVARQRRPQQWEPQSVLATREQRSTLPIGRLCWSHMGSALGEVAGWITSLWGDGFLLLSCSVVQHESHVLWLHAFARPAKFGGVSLPASLSKLGVQNGILMTHSTATIYSS